MTKDYRDMSPSQIAAAVITSATHLGAIATIQDALDKASAKAVHAFARAILHGDEQHRAWLLAAEDAWAMGERLPEVPQKPAESAWRPIETAPQDGTEILCGEWRTIKAYTDTKGNVLVPERKVFERYLARWLSTEALLSLENADMFPEDDPFFEPGFCEEGPSDSFDEVVVKRNPTHWQPLPKPPAQAGEGA